MPKTKQATQLRDLKGFGPKSEEILAKVDIPTVEQFMASDPFELYAKLKQTVKGTGLNSIYAIIGAREDLHWQIIKQQRKTEILLKLDDMGLAPK
ncbi:TfoX/Sxy family DNA transformation protein [Agarivorans sp. DSG3-1]|uniref:TfoX/Sxy family DNA transformation protein n=1 Tax=Agarivorans sp. DSG3-1 TaxID=3342249 RepID=UPI00398F85A5